MDIDNSTFNSIFAKNLRYYLEANQMTQVELSKKLNVGTTSVYNWCAGIKIPRMDKVDKMCQIFGCKRSDLITDIVEDPDINQKALELYRQYQNLSPENRIAFETLLKNLQS